MEIAALKDWGSAGPTTPKKVPNLFCALGDIRVRVACMCQSFIPSPVGGTHAAMLLLGRPETQNPAVSLLLHVGSLAPSSSSPSNIAMAGSVLPGIPGYAPDNLQPWTVAVVASVTVLATVAVVLRMVSRYIKAQHLWWDDYMIIFSLVCRPKGTTHHSLGTC